MDKNTEIESWSTNGDFAKRVVNEKGLVWLAVRCAVSFSKHYTSYLIVDEDKVKFPPDSSEIFTKEMMLKRIGGKREQ